MTLHLKRIAAWSRDLNEREIEIARETAGYTRVIRWPIPYRDFSIPFERSVSTISMIGEVWLHASAAAQREGAPMADRWTRIAARPRNQFSNPG